MTKENTERQEEKPSRAAFGRVVRAFLETLGLSLNVYFDLFDSLLPGRGSREIFETSQFWREVTGSKTRDERIEQLHDARKKLEDGLAAIQELEEEAQRNKRDVEKTLLELENLSQQKKQLALEREEIRRLANADADATRRLFDLPTKAEIFRNRIIGFFAGILISILAAMIFEFVVKPIFV